MKARQRARQGGSWTSRRRLPVAGTPLPLHSRLGAPLPRKSQLKPIFFSFLGVPPAERAVAGSTSAVQGRAPVLPPFACLPREVLPFLRAGSCAQITWLPLRPSACLQLRASAGRTLARTSLTISAPRFRSDGPHGRQVSRLPPGILALGWAKLTLKIYNVEVRSENDQRCGNKTIRRLDARCLPKSELK
jgi:hypothetical protein